MIETCKQRLIRMKKTGGKSDRVIAEKLLESEDSKIPKIAEMSAKLGISNSSVTRFVRRMGYPSFKHFQYEYNNNTTEYNVEHHKFDYSARYAEKAKEIMKKVNPGPIYIISSRRGHPISFMMAHRLEAVNVKVRSFHNENCTIEEFIEMSKEGTLFIISISGYSKVFSDAMTTIAQLEEKPNVILITAAKWMKIFEKYNYISLGDVNASFNSILENDSWENYNNLIIELSMILMNVAKEIYKQKQNSRISRAEKGSTYRRM